MRNYLLVTFGNWSWNESYNWEPNKVRIMQGVIVQSNPKIPFILSIIIKACECKANPRRQQHKEDSSLFYALCLFLFAQMKKTLAYVPYSLQYCHKIKMFEQLRMAESQKLSAITITVSSALYFFSFKAHDNKTISEENLPGACS